MREQARWTRARLGRCGPPLDLLTARFSRHEYAPHTHDEFTVGVTVGGLEVIAYRGGRIVSGPGSIVVLGPGEMHTGGPAASDGYSYRALYAAPALLGDGTLGTGLPHFREPVLDDPELAAACPIRASVITYVNPAVALAAGALLLDEPLTAPVLPAFALILTGSVLATAAAPKPRSRPVPWSTRQTSRAGGRVESLAGLPEERPGSTGQGGG